ncbi:MAG: hypothetical protein RAO94_07250 [Candidatus Stygibacter australis]|nr:hypothetical protein [Candidatus Stygibacter australis]MDP8322129.1 hypothetical protein [Candidatus Stygibacter australis]
MENLINDMNINFDALLKQGFAVIDVRYKEYEIVSEGFKYVIILVDHDREDFYADMLKSYLGHDLEDNNVYEIWLSILKHKLKMSAMLKRDISIKVATLDFLESKV